LPDNFALEAEHSSPGLFFGVIIRQKVLRKYNGSSPAKKHPSEELSGEEFFALTKKYR
jgi:hypothetical protein